MSRRIAAGLVLATTLTIVASRAAAAEVFILDTGGRVVGEWVNRDESPRKQYVVKTSAGAQVTLSRSQVKQVLLVRPEEFEYERIRPSYGDSVAEQWALAEWCRENHLSLQRETHLKRVIELEPGHVAARRALGYYQINGKWVTRQQVNAERGLIRYKGRNRTAQEIELMKQKEEVKRAEGQWVEKLGRWRKWLEGERAPAARQNLRAINDPHAVAGLTRFLKEDRAEQARLMYIEILANIGTPGALMALAACSIADEVEEVRLTCLDYLEKTEDRGVIAFYVGKLGDKDNRVVNLAAVGLSRMKDPSTVGPLIDALETVHKYKITPRNPGSTSATFGNGPGGSGGTGLSMGNRTRIVRSSERNEAVLNALIAITGQNFQFDERSWMYWHASQRKRAQPDVRRR